MKQPQLGEHISEIRKTKGYTQSELAEECNVDIRTVQRIETGEVTPRLFTLRIINEKLGTNFDMNGDSGNCKVIGSKKIIRFGWIAGILLICITPIMLVEALGYFNRFELSGVWSIVIQSIFVGFHVLTVVYFYRAQFFLGKYIENKILPIGAIATIVVVILTNIFRLTDTLLDLSISGQVSILNAILFAITSIVVGLGFVLINRPFKELAVIAGAVQMLAGLFYLFIGIFGIVFGAAALIFQVIYLVKLEKSMVE
jgi:transcriptional regulator with XRE-family HTH domain